MSSGNPIPVVDLFAGPGGLGEGFSSLNNGNSFRTVVSAEMESSAHRTLRLRSFYRILKRDGGRALDSYYRFCNGAAHAPWDERTAKAWEEAGEEARQITLGTAEGNRELDGILKKSGLGKARPWVLIGGPPCQAYSLVGRSRNKGKCDYRAEDDHRHFLYREYLKIIHKYQPAVFVMENVKGILSSKVSNQRIFHTILRDLADPDVPFAKKSGGGYRIYSLSSPTTFQRGMSPDEIDVHQFIVRSEEYGIPQARHRVILLGVREDVARVPKHLEKTSETKVLDAISELPSLRSRISKGKDSAGEWHSLMKANLKQLLTEASKRKELAGLVKQLDRLQRNLAHELDHGSLRMSRNNGKTARNSELGRWYHDERLKVWLNHEARSHMPPDLLRYLYASAYAKVYGRSPKGHSEFDLPGLRPDHKNWESGKFSDRFRVQLAEGPSTTVTSHIAKDGHYYIHPDPRQCRSMTVREAARLQTFPDNYFFQGNRTQQFHQVGNAVPPMLAAKIAKVVAGLLKAS